MNKLLARLPALIAAVILLQTLYFKFSGAPESVYIFSTLGMEPWGRIGSGVAELIAAVLLLVPRTAWMGAAMAMGIMCGAVASHLFILGVEIMGDGGTLFYLALAVMSCSVIVLLQQRQEVRRFVSRFATAARHTR